MINNPNERGLYYDSKKTPEIPFYLYNNISNYILLNADRLFF